MDTERAALIRLEGDPERQWHSAKKLVEAHPEHIAALKTYIHVLQKRRDKSDLEETLVRALELAPQDPSIMGELALLRASAGDKEEALRLVERALKVAPWDPWTLGACAVVAAASDACDQAKLFEHRALTALSEAAPDQIREELKKLLALTTAACKTE